MTLWPQGILHFPAAPKLQEPEGIRHNGYWFPAGGRVFGRRPGLVRGSDYRDIRRAPVIGADAGEHFVGYSGGHLFAELT